jgi:hypothetical protein
MNFKNNFLLLWVIFALLDPLTRLNPDPIQSGSATLLAWAEDVLEVVEAEEEEEEGAGRDRELDAVPAEGRCALAKSSFGALWTARPAL